MFLGACKIDQPVFPAGATFGSSASDSYQPVTKGSYWKYRATAGSIIDTSTITMTGATATFNGKTYYIANSTSRTTGASTGYYHADNHQISLRATSLMAGITAEFYYLNDTMAVNHTWISTLTDDGKVNGVPGRLVGKVIEKGVSKTVGGKAFANVIHTQLDLQYDYGLGTGYMSTMTYDYYTAKGVGMIKVETSVGGVLIGSTDIIDYAIK